MTSDAKPEDLKAEIASLKAEMLDLKESLKNNVPAPAVSSGQIPAAPPQPGANPGGANVAAIMQLLAPFLGSGGGGAAPAKDDPFNEMGKAWVKLSMKNMISLMKKQK